MARLLTWLGASRHDFRLLRFYSLASLVGIVVVVAFLSAYQYRAAVGRMVEHETRSSLALANVFANTLWQRYEAHVRQAGALSPEALRLASATAALRRDVVGLMRSTNVVKVKLYDLEGRTVFSTDPAQIGESRRDSPGFLGALAGEPRSELTFRRSFSAFEQVIVNRNLLSPYIPVRAVQGGPVVAVLEVYSDVTELVDQIDHTQWTVVGSTLAALVVLYGFLWLIVRRAQEMLSAQQGELALRLQQLDQSNRLLARANAFLEATVEDRDRELREALAPTAEPA